MPLRPGWLKRQLDSASRDVASWPAWMRREAGLMDRLEAIRQGLAALERWPVTQGRAGDVSFLLARHDALLAEVGRLRGLLKPFAALGWGREGDDDLSPVVIDHRRGEVLKALGSGRDSTATLGDCRAAAQALDPQTRGGAVTPEPTEAEMKIATKAGATIVQDGPLLVAILEAMREAAQAAVCEALSSLAGRFGELAEKNAARSEERRHAAPEHFHYLGGVAAAYRDALAIVEGMREGKPS